METIILVIIKLAIVYIAYRVGREGGISQGMWLEHLRREEAEARVWQRVQDAARKDADTWETEIDV